MYLLAVTIFNDTRGNAELIKSQRDIFPQEKKYFFSPRSETFHKVVHQKKSDYFRAALDLILSKHWH